MMISTPREQLVNSFAPILAQANTIVLCNLGTSIAWLLLDLEYRSLTEIFLQLEAFYMKLTINLLLRVCHFPQTRSQCSVCQFPTSYNCNVHNRCHVTWCYFTLLICSFMLCTSLVLDDKVNPKWNLDRNVSFQNSENLDIQFAQKHPPKSGFYPNSPSLLTLISSDGHFQWPTRLLQ